MMVVQGTVVDRKVAIQYCRAIERATPAEVEEAVFGTLTRSILSLSHIPS
jgi:hypothetical protein